jgi:GTPase
MININVNEENGESGLSEDDLNVSIANLCKISAKIESDCILLRRRKGDSGFGYVAEYLVRKRAKQNDFQEVRVAVVVKLYYHYL